MNWLNTRYKWYNYSNVRSLLAIRAVWIKISSVVDVQAYEYQRSTLFTLYTLVTL